MLAAIKAFKGPMMLQVGPLDCGNVKVTGIASPPCARARWASGSTRTATWISIADGLNGKPIDVLARR